MNPTYFEQTHQLAGKSVAIALRESLLGMFAGWFGLQVIFVAMSVDYTTPGRSDIGWLPVWGTATGVVCLISWLLVCWPATVVFRRMLLEERMRKWQGILLGGLFGGIAGFIGLKLDSNGYATRGNMVFPLLAAIAGLIAGWVISWRTIRERRKDAFLKQHGLR